MRILLAGDSHRNASYLARIFDVAQAQGCDEIIQLGDFGFGWEWLKLSDELAVCRFSAAASLLAEKTGISASFIDGNHENFDALYSLSLLPDGRREVAPGIFHLPRGHRFEIEGTSFLSCGGAISVDKMARTEHVSWWPQEEITDEDVRRCGADPVDVLLTHDVPWQSAGGDHIHRSGYGLQADTDAYLNRLKLAEIIEATRPRLVIHGHLHRRYRQAPSERYPTEIIGLGADKGVLNDALIVFDTTTSSLSPTDLVPI